MKIRLYVSARGDALAHAYSEFSERDSKYTAFHKWHKDNDANSVLYEIEIPDTQLFAQDRCQGIRGPSKVQLG